MDWQLLDDFTAIRHNESGEIEQKKFTSHAQARQFVENETGVTTVKPHRPTPGRINKRHRPTTQLSQSQQVLKDKAMVMLTGL